jgi:hypothetical protein
LAEEQAGLQRSLGASAYAAGNFERASQLLDAITTGEEFATFLTLAAYRELN